MTNKSIRINQFERNFESISKSIQSIATGLRIQKPSDDIGEFLLSNKSKVDNAIYTKAKNNIDNGATLTDTATEANSSLSNILSDLSSLSSLAENVSVSLKERTALNTEAQALVTKFNKIVTSTTYNNQKLIDGSLYTGIKLQANSSDIGISIKNLTFNSSIDLSSSSNALASSDLIDTSYTSSYDSLSNLKAIQSRLTYTSGYLGDSASAFDVSFVKSVESENTIEQANIIKKKTYLEVYAKVNNSEVTESENSSNILINSLKSIT